MRGLSGGGAWMRGREGAEHELRGGVGQSERKGCSGIRMQSGFRVAEQGRGNVRGGEM